MRRERHGQILDIRYMLDNASMRKVKCVRVTAIAPKPQVVAAQVVVALAA